MSERDGVTSWLIAFRCLFLGCLPSYGPCWVTCGRCGRVVRHV